MDGSAIQFIHESEIHFLSRQPDHGRSIPHLPFFNGERLYVYAPHESGKLMVLHPHDSEHSHYVAKQPFGLHDFRDELWEAMVQRFTVPPIIRIANAVRSDVMNTLGSLHKYFVTLHYGKTFRGLSDTALMAMQLEYALTNHRSFYDLMNDIIVNSDPRSIKQRQRCLVPSTTPSNTPTTNCARNSASEIASSNVQDGTKPCSEPFAPHVMQCCIEARHQLE
jgi:hypothetical protein